MRADGLRPVAMAVRIEVETWIMSNAAQNLLESIERTGWKAPEGARILDFGCGDGSRVYEFRDLGYDAYGFDLFDTVKLRSPEDARFFSALRGRVDPTDTRIADSEIRLPHAAATFDLVFSETVIEHCFALEGMLRECARVLNPDGVSVHTYPSRNSLLEPHLYVPFGGRIQARWWLMLWATLGVRNLGQPNQTAAQTAERNQQWMEVGVCYRSDRQIAAIARQYFAEVGFATREFYSPETWKALPRRYWTALWGKDKLARLAEIQPLVVLHARH